LPGSVPGVETQLRIHRNIIKEKNMKKGLILYVTEGKEALRTREPLDLDETLRCLGMRSICLATSEEEISYQWWRLITRGMHHISCVRATYDDTKGLIHPHGATLRLWG